MEPVGSEENAPEASSTATSRCSRVSARGRPRPSRRAERRDDLVGPEAGPGGKAHGRAYNATSRSVAQGGRNGPICRARSPSVPGVPGLKGLNRVSKVCIAPQTTAPLRHIRGGALYFIDAVRLGRAGLIRVSVVKRQALTIGNAAPAVDFPHLMCRFGRFRPET